MTTSGSGPDTTSHLEADFWGNCANTFGEETKQLLYMREMGFPLVRDWQTRFNFDAKGRSFLDIGGGPCSVLLKMRKVDGTVVDPLEWPPWVGARYVAAGIHLETARGEDLLEALRGRAYDVAFIYNCLQHVDDPEKVVASARAAAKELRMFEWIDMAPHEGHPHMLTASALERWTGRQGRVAQFHGEYECAGRAWILAGG